MLFNATKLLEKMKTAKSPLKQQFNAVSSLKNLHKCEFHAHTIY